MQNSGDLGLLRRLLGEGLRALEGKGSEPDRLACCWVCGRLLLWVRAADLEGVDLRGLAHRLGDLGEPSGRIHPDAHARAVAAAAALQEVTAALVAAGGRPGDPEQPARVVIV